MERKLVIIGGGPGGYVAAIRASQLGVQAVIIEKDKLGGTCLNRGCIPTKTLYKNAEIMNTMRQADAFGVTLSAFELDMPSVQSRKNEIVEKMRAGIHQLMKGNRVEVITGEARFRGPQKLEVVSTDGGITSINAEKIIIATGSVPSGLSVPGVDSPRVISSEEALNLKSVPKSIVICGGGVIGIEFAGIFASFGTEVTVIECAPKILQGLDEEIVKRLGIFLKKKKIKLETNVRITEIKENTEGLQILAETERGCREYFCGLLLTAAGRSPDLMGLNLDAAGVKYDKKGIKVNHAYETSVEGVYAIGDVIGGQMLAHVASEEGKACVNGMYGYDTVLEYESVPSCIFFSPEAAAAGMTEETAKEKGVDYLVGKFVFAANGKAMTMGEADGFVKIIADRSTHGILGVHIIGPHASDLISEGALAIKNKLTIEQIGETIHAHPTLSEALLEAVTDAGGRAVHNLPRAEQTAICLEQSSLT